MGVLKKKTIDSMRYNVLVVLALASLFSLESCAQSKVFDIVSNKHLKPKAMFKKGNYITDVYSEQYIGVWISSDYKLDINKKHKVEIGGIYKDENIGTLTKLGTNGEPVFTLTFNFNSMNRDSAYGLFEDLDKYGVFLKRINTDQEELELEFEERERINVKLSNDEKMLIL
jgi:hypothetical protein